MNIRSVISLLSLLLLAGCSIKEDRSECPGQLILDFSQVQDFDSVGVHFIAAGFDSTRTYHREEYSSADPLKIVASEVECMAFYGTDRFASAERLAIESSCPEVWFCTQTVRLEPPHNVCVLMLCKQYCTLDMTIKYSGPGEIESLLVKVKSSSAGYYRDGSIAQGDFICTVSPSSEGKCSLNLPRQKDARSLTLSIEDGDACKVFPLGKYLQDAGYDWQASSLEDISTVIDLAMLNLSLSIQSIDETYCYTDAII